MDEEWKAEVYGVKKVDNFHLTDEWKKLRKQVIERDGNKCKVCGKKRKLTVHHIKPRDEGGTNALNNLETLCQKCHDEIEMGGEGIVIEDKRPEATDWHAWVYGGARRPEN